jgi:hypothetical protein
MRRGDSTRRRNRAKPVIIPEGLVFSLEAGLAPEGRLNARHTRAGQRYLPGPTGFADSTMRKAQ